MVSITHVLLLPFVQAAASKLVPALNGGLSSHSNYFLHNDGKVLHQIQANLTIQKDFITSDTGAAFCLNGYAPALDKSTIVYQQICIESFPPGSNLWCVLTTFTRTNVSFGQQFELAGLDDPHTIPAGTEMAMSFTTDKKGTVTGAKFQVIVDGKPSTKEIEIKKNQWTAKAARVTGTLTAFKFNIGGTSDTGVLVEVQGRLTSHPTTQLQQAQNNQDFCQMKLHKRVGILLIVRCLRAKAKAWPRISGFLSKESFNQRNES